MTNLAVDSLISWLNDHNYIRRGISLIGPAVKQTRWPCFKQKICFIFFLPNHNFHVLYVIRTYKLNWHWFLVWKNTITWKKLLQTMIKDMRDAMRSVWFQIKFQWKRIWLMVSNRAFAIIVKEVGFLTMGPNKNGGNIYPFSPKPYSNSEILNLLIGSFHFFIYYHIMLIIIFLCIIFYLIYLCLLSYGKMFMCCESELKALRIFSSLIELSVLNN